MEFIARNIGDTQKIAADMASAARAGDILLLHGDLGAGKTSFARAFINSLLPGADVTSPTFAIMHVYDGNDHTPDIVHADLYRINDEREIYELGLEEYINSAITLIEWPENAGSFFDWHKTTHIYINYTENADERLTIVK